MNFFDSHFTNMLSPWQWAALAAVPPAIVLLYFLKLRRQPLEVPSTYLWSRTIEDLHVNSIWQRLRRSLLLLLQLLLIALLALACLRPGWRGAQLAGDRFVFLVDASASMSATDVAPTRLEAAKAKTLALIDQMKSGDAAMIISFSDVARIEQPFTDNRRLLRSRTASIEQTNRPTDLAEALRAASGLANPGRSSINTADSPDIRVAEARPATLYLVSDGSFQPVVNFSLGNLEPRFVPIGEKSAANLAIVAFSVERNPEKAGRLQAFGRIENHGPTDVTTDASLSLDGALADAQQVKIPAGGEAGVKFDLQDLERGLLKLEIAGADALSLDDVAYTAINLPRPAKVLIVTPRNDALELALRTDEATKLANISVVEPNVLDDKEHQDLLAAGYYDMVVYDQCVPTVMPQANTLFIGRTPPIEGWSAGDKGFPRIIDVDRGHPLMQLVEMNQVKIAEGFSIRAPRGAKTLIDADLGPLAVVAPRQGFEDAAIGFEIVGKNAAGELMANTDWPRWYSFPVFVRNSLEYLGGNRSAQATPTVRPGLPITLRTETPQEKIVVRSPGGERHEVMRDSPNTFVFANTRELGVYDVLEDGGKQASQQFAVNLFDSRESDLTPASDVRIGHSDVAGQAGAEPTRRDLWKWLLGGALAVLVFEWYVYNRRVYI